MRWAAVLLIAIPFVLLLALAASAVTHNRDAANSARHALRIALLSELSLIVILAIWGMAYERVSEARDLRLHPPPGRLIDLGGYRVHVYCSGQGRPTVVLEHGLDGSFLDWRLVQPEIAQFTRVCSYDRPGYGSSDRSPKPRMPGVMADELRTLLKNAGEKPPFVLVAHSMGSFNAIMYAHKHSDEVAGLVLVDGSHPDEIAPFPWKKKLELRLLQFTAPFGLPRWRGWCAGKDPALRALRASVNCRSRVFQTHYEQWAAWPRAAAEMRELKARLSLPVVVISRDPASGRNPGREEHWAQLQKQLLQISTNSTQIIAEGSGHGIPGRRPDIIVQAVRSLLDRK